MPELHLQRVGEQLTITFGDHHVSVPWSEVAPGEHTGQQVFDAADHQAAHGPANHFSRS